MMKNPKQVFLVLSDKATKPIIKHFEEVKNATTNSGDSFFLFHQKEAELTEVVKNINHFVFTDQILNELGYQPIENSLIPGSNHFPLLKFYLQNPNYDYYWNIEDDVHFQGDWNYLFDTFSENESDFISCHVETYYQNLMWSWWGTLKYKGESLALENQIKSFNPIYRISNQALLFLHQSLLDGWSGHHEALIPTLLHTNGFRILDFGGTGDFTLPNFEHKFYTNETMYFTTVSMGNKLNTLYHPIKDMKIDKQATKKHCVISAVGEKSLHKTWIKENPDFDLHLIVYDNSLEKFQQDTPYMVHSKGYKFRLVHNYLQNNPDFLDHYDYFYIPDDDIDIDTENIHHLFKYMKEYNLELAQPALTDSYYTYSSTTKRHRTLLRYTNFVEVMHPCFSREALKKVLFTFDGNASGWGIDFHWGQLLDASQCNTAIIDDITSIHTRAVQSFSSENQKQSEEYLKKHNLTTSIVEYKTIPNENYKRIPRMEWKSIITDPEKRKKIENRLERIANTLALNVDFSDNLGLFSGKMGILIFFFNYYRLTGNKKYENIACDIFESVYGKINIPSYSATFSDGLPGISWTVEYLAQNDFIENNTDEILEEFCANIGKIAVSRIADFGLNEGVAGYAMHYVARLSNPNHTEKVVNHLHEKFNTLYVLDCVEDFLYQNIDITEENNEKKLVSPNFTDLGTFDGIVGIIASLCQLHSINLNNSKVIRLLNQYVQYLLQYEQVNNSGLHFPTNINESSYVLDWNYGDLAVANVLLQAAKIANNKAWHDKAIELALRTTTIQNEYTNASLFSGTMGIAHLYHRFYQNTSIEEFKNAAHYWIEKTIENNTDKGLAGFSVLEKSDTQYEIGILKGLAGIGLALIASISEFEPQWDSCLLIS